MSQKSRGGAYVPNEAKAYMSHDLYERPRESFKFAGGLIREHRISAHKDLIDLGCANGAFIHYLSTLMPDLNFVGVDITPEFIDIARRGGTPNARFEAADLITASGQYDIVTCVGTLPMFDSFEKVLDKTLNLVRPGGLVLVDGFFNEFNLDVRTEWRENPLDENAPWHIGFNQFSRARMKKWLDARGLRHSFHDRPFNIDLPRDPNARPSNAWTFRDENGSRILTNGVNIILKFVALLIHAR